jgi:hypothetical protein
MGQAVDAIVMEIERARRVINWRVAALEQSRVAVFGNLYVRTQCAATNVPAHPHARSRYALPRGRHCQHGVRRATPACSHRAVKTGCAHGGADERTTLSAPSSPSAPHPTDTRSSSPRARTPSIRPCTASFRRRAARDFTPVSHIANSGGLVVVAHPAFPARTLEQLIEQAKTSPRQSCLRLRRLRPCDASW